MTTNFDVAIIGSGFSGSILAWILASQGRSVALIDPVAHPRFAIGESSTPIADLLLRRLGETYQLPPLQQLSTYGSWQEHLPQLACGRKRGFSYYAHQPDQEFHDTPDHQRSLLVAASASDPLADTHWFRRDVDQFFFEQATTAGADSYSGHSLSGIETGQPHRLTLSDQRAITACWLIDASGRAAVSARLLKQKDLVGQLATDTESIYGHFRGVPSWRDLLIESGHDVLQDPFHADDSAQHHLHRDGWIWMLRFNNGITSVGYTQSAENGIPKSLPHDPSIRSLIEPATLVDPDHAMRGTGRLQRLFCPLVAPRCLMLPSTACTIDPLHSTGIAQARWPEFSAWPTSSWPIGKPKRMRMPSCEKHVCWIDWSALPIGRCGISQDSRPPACSISPPQSLARNEFSAARIRNAFGTPTTIDSSKSRMHAATA